MLPREEWRAPSAQQFKDYIKPYETLVASPQVSLEVPPYYQNREGNRRAIANLERDSDAALSLALAYRVFGASGYYGKAMSILFDWTSLERVIGSESRLQLTYRGIKFLEAMWHCRGDGWHQWFMDWVVSVYLPSASILREQKNNSGAWGWCGAIYAAKVIGVGVGQKDLDGLLAHIRAAVCPYTGLLWREAMREESGIWYHYFALAPYTQALLDVKEMTGQNHLGLLTKSYDLLYNLCLYPDTWPWKGSKGIIGWIKGILFPHAPQLERPTPTGWPSSLLETVATRILYRPQYLEYIQRPLIEGHVFRFSTLKWAWGIEA